ncbi:MAG: XdhC family protein, partial [Paracoccaceae bacterium]
MSFDLKSLESAVAQHGRVVRLVVADVRGSAPREVGAAMLVWADGQSGTIGGGALELQASERARAALSRGDWLERFALGPTLGQCCGGAVTLLAEVYDQARLAGLGDIVVCRKVSGQSEMPMKFRKQLSEARNSGAVVQSRLVAGWMIEAITKPS